MSKIKPLTKIKPNTLVKLDIDYLENGPYRGTVEYYKNLLELGDGNLPLLCLGEIVNQRGHYSVVTRSGKVVVGVHPEIFRLPTDSEL